MKFEQTPLSRQFIYLLDDHLVPLVSAGHYETILYARTMIFVNWQKVVMIDLHYP
jgi:hypothetical protein